MLGDSEILSIKHSPKSHIPALRKGPDDRLKVLAIIDSEQVKDIFKHHPARLNLFEYAYDFPEQAATRSPKPSAGPVTLSATGNADVLARESSGDDVNCAEVVGTTLSNVLELDGVTKSIGKHSPVNRVEFDLPGGAVTCGFKSDIKASYACKQAANGELLHA